MAELLSVQVHIPPTSNLYEKSSKKSSLDSVNRAGRDFNHDNQNGTFAQLPKKRAANVEFKDLIYKVREGGRHKGEWVLSMSVARA